jgi:aminopeptidase
MKMNDPRIKCLADLLVNYSIQVQPGEKVAIRSSSLAEPLLNEIYGHVLKAGGFPFLALKFPETDDFLFENAADEQLKHTSEIEQYVVNNFDALVMVAAPANTRALNRIADHKVMLARQAEGPLIQRTMIRAAAGSFKWVATLFPTHALAQEANMSLGEYEDIFFKACLSDMHDPIGYWKQVEKEQEKIINRLTGRQNVHIVAEDTDLRLRIDGRIFENACGRVNMPDGEIFTAPVEESANGHVHFSYPVIYQGHEIAGAQLWFENGKVVKSFAERNEKFLNEAILMDAGAQFLGEFAIGTNSSIDRFTGQILIDEKMGGTFHLALGNSYPQTGGKNRSSLHLDMICDLRKGGEIQVDGETFFRDGKFFPRDQTNSV